MLLDYISNVINNLSIPLEKQKVVIGVSTGVDSMTLLFLLEQLIKKENIKIVVAHVNHKKRIQSDEEEIFLESYCKKNNLMFYVYHLENIHNNFQEEARKKRYEFFLDVMNKEKSSYLFLAHHLNDDMETFFMRFIRGSSPKGYLGMQMITNWQDKFIIRPLLNITKDQIIDYALKNNIQYYEDDSNQKDDYTRNRIRHHWIPFFLEENPNFYNQYFAYKNLLSFCYTKIEEEKQFFINNFIKQDNNKYSFFKDDFLNLNHLIQEEILFTLFSSLHLSKKNVQEIIRYINSSRNLDLIYQGIRFQKEYDNISLSININNNTSFFQFIIDKEGIYPIDSDRYIKVIYEDFLNDEKKNINSLTNLNILWYNKRDLPIIVRNKKNGDKMSLECGTKKVMDIFIDQKISHEKRNKAIIIEKDQQILAILGIRKSKLLKSIAIKNLKIELIENNVSMKEK